jgi:hypothetical protein
MTEQVSVKGPSRFAMALKYRLAVASVMISGLVGMASATVNFTPITDLIDAVVGIIPSLMDLIVAIAPMIVLISIVSFLVYFFRDTILGMLKF